MAFTVEDIHAEYKRLSAAGVKFRSEPIPIAAGVNRGGGDGVFSRSGRSDSGTAATAAQILVLWQAGHEAGRLRKEHTIVAEDMQCEKIRFA